MRIVRGFCTGQAVLMTLLASMAVGADVTPAPERVVSKGEDADPSTGNTSTGDSLFVDGAYPDPTDEQLRSFLKPIPPKTPAEAMQTFEMVDGFEMQLVAAEPLVHDPIAAAFDANGNLYVCEMRDYPYQPAEGDRPIGSVRLLRDTDGDGRFDESHVFADELLWAGGVAPWKGGVYVTSPPDIWYMKDTDGDFAADVRRKVYTGFGTRSQQHMLNNLQMGLDFKFYGSTSSNGGRVKTIANPHAPLVDLRGHDFRFDPVTEQIEPVTGTVQFGTAFDDWGNRFLCSESQPLRHVVLPQEYLERSPYFAASSAIHNAAPGPVPIHRISPIEAWRHIRSSRRIAANSRPSTAAGASHHVIDAAAGVTVYRGGAYPPEMYGDVFIADGQNNLIHRRRLLAEGVTFGSKRVDLGTEFCRSSDLWFRPVNFVNAPDGTLYVLDMSREILESIHIPLDVVKHLDLTSGRSQGRIYRMAPRGFQSPPPPRLGSATPAELVAALESPHGWWRDTARRLIYERQDLTAVEPLRELLKFSDKPQVRVQAIWLLNGLNTLSKADLMAALADPSPRVREHAVRLSEPWLDHAPEILVRLVACADDSDARVRFQTALSLGETSDARAVSALVKLAKSNARDSWMRTAVYSSIAGSTGELLLDLLNDPDAVLSDAGREVIGDMASILGARNNVPEIEEVLDAVARRPAVRDNAPLQEVLLRSLGQSLGKAGGQLCLRSEKTPDAASMIASVVERTTRVAADHSQNQRLRQEAIGLLGSLPVAGVDETLAGLLDPLESSAIQIAVVRALANFNDVSIAEHLIDGWRSYPPDVLTEVLATLCAREQWCLQLLQCIEDNAHGELLGYLDAGQRARLLDHHNEHIRSRAAKLIDSRLLRERQAVIDQYQAVLERPGSISAGKAIFDKQCSTCHRIGDSGFSLGPDLTASPHRAADALLVHILDPNRVIQPQYVQYFAADTNGRTYTGMLVSQTATSLTLTRDRDTSVTLLRRNIDQLISSGKSAMPEGLEKQITLSQMSDLLAYLQEVHPPTPSNLHEEPDNARDIGTQPGLIEPVP
jgi:putative membrane-bound dehydrogenase-like protein